MNVDWASLGAVAVTTIWVTFVVVLVVSLVAIAVKRTEGKRAAGQSAVLEVVTYRTLMVLLAGGVLFALYLLVPYFH